MRTQQEIFDRYKASDSMLGFDKEVLLGYLDFDTAKPLLKEDTDKEKWDSDISPNTREAITKELEEYHEFAVGKALDHRGISASRSIQKLKEWLWLLEDDEMVAFLSAGGNYENYGMPMLKAVAKKYDFPFPDSDEAHNMARGEPCTPHCGMGCGE